MAPDIIERLKESHQLCLTLLPFNRARCESIKRWQS